MFNIGFEPDIFFIRHKDGFSDAMTGKHVVVTSTMPDVNMGYYLYGYPFNINSDQSKIYDNIFVNRKDSMVLIMECHRIAENDLQIMHQDISYNIDNYFSFNANGFIFNITEIPDGDYYVYAIKF